MQIVIELDDDVYKEITEEFLYYAHTLEMASAIKEGIPLPKGHGDLIDINRKITVPIYDEQYEEWEEKILTVREVLNKWSDEGITVKDIVVLADKEEEE